MKREIEYTKDGSATFYVPNLDEHYHSVYGAYTESMHIFIQTGFRAIKKNNISIFEVGFGTGLNTFLTFKEAAKYKKCVKYCTIEKYPLIEKEYNELNYVKDENKDEYKIFLGIHEAKWDETIELSPFFSLRKYEADIKSLKLFEKFDLIYFDAFSPEVQPELWSKLIFQELYNSLKNGGILTTYCSKSSVRGTMKEVGFEVEKLPGPPHKREIVRAIKIF